MSKHDFELRRLALMRLIQSLHNERTGRGGIARLNGFTGINASYISRMLYEEGKPGKKNIGEDTVNKISESFPDWLRSDYETGPKQLAYVAREEAAPTYAGENVVMIPVRTDEITGQIMRMLADTDDVGRAMCLAAVKVALSDYAPSVKKQQKS